jgi:hypothetical protein
MQRKLVISNEAARHPLRQRIAPISNLMAFEDTSNIKWWKQEDTHLFVISFVAFFIVFTTFFA